MFAGCPIHHEKVIVMKNALERNTTLVQCTFGTMESEQDIQEIEMIMERNFRILSQ